MKGTQLLEGAFRLFDEPLRGYFVYIFVPYVCLCKEYMYVYPSVLSTCSVVTLPV